MEFIFAKTLQQFRRDLQVENIRPEYFSIDIKTKDEAVFFRLYSLIKRLERTLARDDYTSPSYTTVNHTNKIQCTFMGICVKIILMQPRKKNHKVALPSNIGFLY